MLELGSSGSVRGVSSNGHPYRDPGPIAVVVNPTEKAIRWHTGCYRAGATAAGTAVPHVRPAPPPAIPATSPVSGSPLWISLHDS